LELVRDPLDMDISDLVASQSAVGNLRESVLRRCAPYCNIVRERLLINQ